MQGTNSLHSCCISLSVILISEMWCHRDDDVELSNICREEAHIAGEG